MLAFGDDPIDERPLKAVESEARHGCSRYERSFGSDSSVTDNIPSMDVASAVKTMPHQKSDDPLQDS